MDFWYTVQIISRVVLNGRLMIKCCDVKVTESKIWLKHRTVKSICKKSEIFAMLDYSLIVFLQVTNQDILFLEHSNYMFFYHLLKLNMVDPTQKI